jgi:very-short-patch-repair endonuclease
MNNHHYNKKLVDYAYELRTTSVSRAEKTLWKVLARKQQGVGFKRQRPIANFIVDFFAQEIGLIIEVDGNSHVNKGDYDRFREDQLKDLGFTLLRFNEGDVINNLGDVLSAIQHAVYCLKEKRKG